MFDISGTIKKIFEEQTFGSGFTKREFVITTTAERYPQDLKFECVKDKIAQLSAFKVGDPVKVSFDLRGREWKESYFVNLSAWKVERAGDAAPGGPDDEPLPQEPGQTVDTPDDDIPF